MATHKDISKPVIIYGKHAVFAALENKTRLHHSLNITQDTYKHYQGLLSHLKIKICIKKNNDLNAMCGNAPHQGIILKTTSVFLYGIAHLEQIVTKKQSCIAILDRITDPQNIGSIIRSALAFKIDALIMPNDNSPDETPSMVKSSSGAIEKIPIIKVTNLANTIKHLQSKGYWIIGLDSSTENSINQLKLSNKTVFILGSEGKGMRPLTKSHCDLIAKIPISNKIESINVSNAAAIAMYEYSKLLLYATSK